jgi:hypothetical protein
MGKCSEIRGLTKCFSCIAKAATRVTINTFTPSLLTYFAWTGIIYIACATFAMIEWYGIHDFFCKLPAQEKGCDNCADNLLMCPKSTCWQEAVNLTIQEDADTPDDRYFEAFQSAVQDLGCNSLVETSESPVKMVRNIQSSLESGTATPACKQWNCRVLVKALRNVSSCSELCREGSLTAIAELERSCGLDGVGLAADAERLCNAQPARVLSEHAGMPGLWYDAVWQNKASEELNGPLADSSVPARMQRRHLRRLTNATTNAANEGSDAWDVGGWSKCTCLQQCTAGLRTRSVTCPSGEGRCKMSEMPANAEACTCWHCARCTVRFSIVGFAIGYFTQGGCSLLLWLAFLRVSYLDEEDLTHVSWRMKVLGCVCKVLPRLVRIGSFFALGFILLLIGQTWLPTGEFNVACKQNDKLQVMAICIALCWVAQIVIGVFMKRRSPMPAYLFNARKPGVMRALCRPVRAIGP